MSLYNMLFGMNPNSDIILAIVGLKKNDIERYRDCGIDENEISITTRTGGWNRDDYPNESLTKSPYYVSDCDDDFDSTYAYYSMRIPDEVKAHVRELLDPLENGISSELLKWCMKTLRREETESDIYTKIYEECGQLCSNLTHASCGVLNAMTFNGHTLIPLTRSAEKQVLLFIEKHGKFPCYCIKPYEITIVEHQGAVRFETTWKVLRETWERWKADYSVKFPNAIEYMDSDMKRSNVTFV